MPREVPLAHPGEILKELYLEPLNLSANKLGKMLGVPHNRKSELVRGRRNVTADTALRLAKCFGSTPESWMNLQSHYDLVTTEEAIRDRIKAVKKVSIGKAAAA